MHRRLIALVLAALVSPAAAAETQAPQATIGVERHRTTNALDSDLAFDDWYTLVRGALQHEIELSGTAIKLGGEFQATRYDEYDFENDLALALSAEATRKLHDGLEIRGTLAWKHFSEGDDLPVANLVLPTRTPTDTLLAGVEAGADLGHRMALVLGALATLEVPRATRFPGIGLAEIRLHPERRSLRLSAALTRNHGPYSYGLRTNFQATEATPFPLGVGYRLATLKAEGKLTRPGGLTLGGALGIQWLAGDEAVFEELRPTLQIALSQKLTGGIELRGSFAAAYESSDTDDPLASYVRRLELEAKMPLRRELSIGAGVYLETKHNLLLGYDERDRGVYAELTYRIDPASDVVLRIDYSRDVLSVLDIRKNTLDAYLGVTRRL